MYRSEANSPISGVACHPKTATGSAEAEILALEVGVPILQQQRGDNVDDLGAEGQQGQRCGELKQESGKGEE